jgi:RimJ/RimL family protein N-acetyltransferase
MNTCEGEVILRSAKPADAEQVISLMREVASEPDSYMSFTPDEASVPVGFTAGLIQKYNDLDNLYLVGDHDGRIIADLTCAIDPRWSLCSHVAVLGMEIQKKYRGQGLGTLMVEHAIEWARRREVVRLELEVFEENGAAIRLYTKFGFEIEGCKRAYVFQRGAYYNQLIMSRLFKVS